MAKRPKYMPSEEEMEMRRKEALPVDDGRYYKVTINDKHTPVWYNEVMKIPVLPFFINICGSYSGINEVRDLGSNNYYYDKVNKYILNIESYKCYFGNYQMECKNDTHVMKKIMIQSILG